MSSNKQPPLPRTVPQVGGAVRTGGGTISVAILNVAAVMGPTYVRNLCKKVQGMSTPCISVSSMSSPAPVFGSFTQQGD